MGGGGIASQVWQASGQQSLLQDASYLGFRRPTPRYQSPNARRARLEPAAPAPRDHAVNSALRHVDSLTAEWALAQDAAYCLSTAYLFPTRRPAECEHGGMILTSTLAPGVSLLPRRHPQRSTGPRGGGSVRGRQSGRGPKGRPGDDVHHEWRKAVMGRGRGRQTGRPGMLESGRTTVSTAVLAMPASGRPSASWPAGQPCQPVTVWSGRKARRRRAAGRQVPAARVRI